MGRSVEGHLWPHGPSGKHPLSKLIELTLGHLRFKLKKKEEQIIETQDKPQCLVATKATLTLTVPGCNRVVYRGFIASAI